MSQDAISAQVIREQLDRIAREVQAPIRELKADFAELQQKSVRRGSDFGSDYQRESTADLLIKNSGFDGLREGTAKSLRVGLKGFGGAAKATITSADVPMQGERDREVYGPLRRVVSVRDLLPARTTTAASIEFLQAARTGTAAVQATEGAIKAELALSFDLQTAFVRTIACWIPASRQALDDAAMLRDYVETELRDALRVKEDQQLLKGDGTGANILGLWTSASAYSRAVVGDTRHDALRRAITQIQLSRGVANGIVLNPEALEALELTKDAEDRYLVAYSVTDSNNRTTSWRVPVVVSDTLDANEFLVGDFERACRVYDRQQASLEISREHADYFTKNLVALLCEERLAMTIPRPDLLVAGAFV